MKTVERATVIHCHRHRIAEHSGDAAEALGWRNAQSQQLRFEVVSAAADFNGCSVLDYLGWRASRRRDVLASSAAPRW